jgi:hypothetical protein
VTAEQIPSFIQAVKKMSTEARYQPSYMIQAAMKLSNIEVTSGKEYPAAIAEFETAIKSKKELDKENEERTNENSRLQIETEKNRRLRNETLEQVNTTSQELSGFQSCKTALLEYGLHIEDVETVRKAFDNIKEAGGNPRLVVTSSRSMIPSRNQWLISRGSFQ